MHEVVGMTILMNISNLLELNYIGTLGEMIYMLTGYTKRYPLMGKNLFVYIINMLVIVSLILCLDVYERNCLQSFQGKVLDNSSDILIVILSLNVFAVFNSMKSYSYIDE